MHDKEFLQKLDRAFNKALQIKIIALTPDELPAEEIVGHPTGGSINIEGTSAMRRSCDLTLATETQNISDYLWTFNRKFKVQIGVENNIDPTQPNVIWFDQGVYIINSFSASYSTSNCTISIKGTDKMCLLDGSVGGIINSQTVFDSYEVVEEDYSRKIKAPLRQIIRDMVYQFGKEQMHNIIINDLDKTGLELLEYRYDTPLYLLRPATGAQSNQYTQATLNKNFGGHDLSTLQYDKYAIDGSFTPGSNITVDGEIFYVMKIEAGETAGFREVELTYPGDLIAQPGETVVSVLNKIKTVLGDYEYFYDIDGRFVFQQKKVYLNTAWSPIITNENEQSYVDPYALTTPYSYNFSDTALFTSFNSNPTITNLKNDFTVIGTKDSGAQIHMRYAIDKKPKYYKTIAVSQKELEAYNKKFGFNVQPQSSQVYWYGTNPGEGVKVDWREILFHMQKDYRKYGHLDNFLLKVAEANPEYYSTGITGYEQYYIDIEGFWRYLFTPLEELRELPGVEQQEYYWGMRFPATCDNDKQDQTKIVRLNDEEKIGFPEFKDGHYPKDTTIRVKFTRGHIGGNKDIFLQIAQTDKEKEKCEDMGKKVILTSGNNVPVIEPGQYYIFYYEPTKDGGNGAWILRKESTYFEENRPESHPGWRKAVYEAPSQLLFWFDMLEANNSDLDKYSVKAVGSRSRVENDKSVKAIWYGDTPQVIFDSDGYENNSRPGMKYFNVNEAYYADMFSRSAQGKSAKDALDSLLYNYTYCTDSITIQSVPIYYLEPNTLIYIDDPQTGIRGDYLITRISLPLTYNGTMSLTGTKMVPRLY